MSNNEIVSKLEEQFGPFQTLMFCGINAYMHQLAYDEIVREGNEDYHDHAYEADWWKDEYNRRHDKYTEDTL